jgi:Tfp pilus assembly protein PilW
MRRRVINAVRSLRGEGGFSMIDVLVAAGLSLMLIGVGSTVMVTVFRAQPGQTDRGNKIEDSRNAMERLTREIRQGSTIYSATPTQVSFLTYVHSATCGGAASDTAIRCVVTYNCTSSSCSRTEAAPPPSTASGPAVTVISGLSSSSVFGYGTSCSPTGAASSGYICATLTFPATNGDDAITVQDGAAFANPPSPAS